jgi:NitT/TauT family transport system substrate-binding protein
MTSRGKLVLTFIILAVVGLGIYRWKDQILPPEKSRVVSVDPQAVAKAVAAAQAQAQAQQKTSAEKAAADAKEVAGKLLAGDKAVSLVDGSSIPAVVGVSDYAKPMHNGKPLINFPINVWPGWAPIIVANGGQMEPNDASVFFRKHGFYVKLSIVDDPVKERDLFASGHSPIMWGTLDMFALFAPELAKDSRTIPVIVQQVDFSAGGDGVVARGDIRNVNDFRIKNGHRRKVVLAQNSPSHYFFMSLLLDAGIDPAQVDFRWAADAPAAAKIFVQDTSFEAFVGWAPDIYTVSDKVPGTRLVVTTSQASRLVADVWAVRNDFYRDNPTIVSGLVRGIFEGMDMVRADVPGAAQALSKAFNIPVEDCAGMIGKDGGITTGDAHLTNYRENVNFFLDPMNPSSFEVIWNRAATIYKSLGVIDTVIPASKVKGSALLAKLSEEYKDVRDLSQPVFKPGALFKSLEAETGELLSKSVIITFPGGKSDLNAEYDPQIPTVLEEIGKLAGAFGNAYLIIEGNADASKKGVVPADLVRQLSYDRADSVRKAILSRYNFDPNKFKVVGNGWDNPAPGFTDNSNPEHNKRNRRVEIKVFPLETQ